MYQTQKKLKNSNKNNLNWKKYVAFYSNKKKSKKKHKTVKYFSKIKTILKSNPELVEYLFAKKGDELIRLKKDSQTLLLDYIGLFRLKDSKLYYNGNKVILKIPRNLL